MIVSALKFGLRSQTQLVNACAGVHARGHSCALPKKPSSEASMRVAKRLPGSASVEPAFSPNIMSNMVSTRKNTQRRLARSSGVAPCVAAIHSAIMFGRVVTSWLP